MECFAKPVAPEIRKRIGYCLEEILISSKCEGEVQSTIRKNLMPALMQIYHQGPATHYEALMTFLVNALGGSSSKFFELCMFPHQDLVEKLLVGPGVQSEEQSATIKAKRAELFLRICQWIQADAIPDRLVDSYIPELVLPCVSSSSVPEESKKQILEAMAETAGKDLFHGYLVVTIQACLAASKDEELK